MGISIKYKLFFTLFLTTTIVVASMYFFMQWSFHRGFLNYANSQALENMDPLAENLVEFYETEGEWQSFRDNQALWHTFQSGNRPVPESNPARPPSVLPGARESGVPGSAEPRPPGNRMDPLNVGPRTLLLDADRERIAGGAMLEDIDDLDMPYLKPLEYDGETVGYLTIVPMEELYNTVDILYVKQQTRIFGIIALAALMVSVLLAIPLVHHLLVPVKAMIRGAEKLTTGEYGVRIPVTTGDELASLSKHFNILAATLERNEKSRRRYMADVSHDLRTPLAILLGEIEAVQDGVRDVESTLPVLHSEVRHLNRLVGDLHELSLSDIGALNYRKHPIDPVIALEQAIEQYTSRMVDRSIDLTSTLPGEGTLRLNADPNRLHQLFTNLLENSLRYTDAGGRVDITMHRKNRNLKVCFQDSAPGVPEEVLPKIFARLYRVETSRNREKGGSGLGLAICWNIVEAHGGRIEAQPSSLGGLAVRITLPLL